MPKRTDIEKIMVIGSGPIVIGQACEFDYSGTQAVKALKEEGYEVILINSNPATIMTDPELSDRVYIEPITLPYLKKIIELEKPCAILPTVGGQTALNAALALAKDGILDEYEIELIGAKKEAIEKAEDRELFRLAMHNIGCNIPRSGVATSMESAELIMQDIGLPLILRPSFTLGGTGGGICFSKSDFSEMVKKALDASPTNSVLIEQSVLGWKEFELEVMRDLADNVVIICSIENLDPMGVHTGDSITVAPQQTLSDREYQNLRDMAIRIIREIGVETGGSNIQFAVNPANGEVIVIEMNPRVSRSSALASKATGFPIAKIAAKLSVGYTLNEILNDITKKTPASFEPTIDYIVTKIPRFTFEKFPDSPRLLDTQMRSVGEAMAIGRSFGESFQKAVRSLETGRMGWGVDGFFNLSLKLLKHAKNDTLITKIKEKISRGSDERIFYIREAIVHGIPLTEIYKISQIDPWFLNQFKKMIDLESRFRQLLSENAIVHQALKATDKDMATITGTIEKITNIPVLKNTITKLLQNGYCARQLAYLIRFDEIEAGLKQLREFSRGTTEYLELEANLHELLDTQENFMMELLRQLQEVVYKRVDTCAAEFESHTPYLYSSYDQEDESEVSQKEKVMILGGGPNRIGQGIEFDYCCCHASFALQELGIESIMVNSNPETVSTDYDTSDRLYFEPLSIESILHIYNNENKQGKLRGVILQFGGQTPLRLAAHLAKHNITILGTSVENIDRAEDRKFFNQLIQKLGLKQPTGAMASSEAEAIEAASKIGYPILARPSYVLGGRAMAIVHSEEMLREYMNRSTEITKQRPVLIDQFLEDAVEIDVDALCDGKEVFIAGILEHIEEAGIHSGDSACILPTRTISKTLLGQIREATKKLALELQVIGCINIQFAIQEGSLFVIEVNPRASRTIPFISKAIGIPLAKMATKIIMGKSLKELKLTKEIELSLFYVKEVVLPFKKFANSDTMLGPEMKSTGEVMGIGKTPAEAFYKSQEAAYQKLPLRGEVFISVNNSSKKRLLESVRKLAQCNFEIYASEGTAEFFKKNGIEAKTVLKVHEGRPNIIDKIKDGEIDLVINTPTNFVTRSDAMEIRQACLQYNLPYMTTVSAATSAMEGIIDMQKKELQVYPITAKNA